MSLSASAAGVCLWLVGGDSRAAGPAEIAPERAAPHADSAQPRAVGGTESGSSALMRENATTRVSSASDDALADDSASAIGALASESGAAASNDLLAGVVVRHVVRDDDERARALARAHGLVEQGDPAAVEDLVDWLATGTGDPREDLSRHWAAAQIGRLADARSADALRELLPRVEPELRPGIARGLERAGENWAMREQVGAWCAGLAGASAKERAQTLRRAAGLASPTCETLFSDGLADPDADVRRAALRGLVPLIPPAVGSGTSGASGFGSIGFGSTAAGANGPTSGASGSTSGANGSNPSPGAGGGSSSALAMLLSALDHSDLAIRDQARSILKAVRPDLLP